MQEIIGGVHGEEAQDAAARDPTDDGDECVDDPEDDQEEPCIRPAATDGNQGDHSARDMHHVMDGIDLEPEEVPIGEETGNADEDKDDADDPCRRFHHMGREGFNEKL